MPFRYRLQAIPLNPVRHGCLHQRFPPLHAVIGSGNRTAFEQPILHFCHFGWHESQFHIRRQTDRQDEIEQQIRIGKIIPRRSILIFLIDMHIVIENSMEPQIRKTQFLFRAPQLLLYSPKQAVARIADIHQTAPRPADRQPLPCCIHCRPVYSGRLCSSKLIRCIIVLQQCLDIVRQVSRCCRPCYFLFACHAFSVFSRRRPIPAPKIFNECIRTSEPVPIGDPGNGIACLAQIGFCMLKPH